MIANIINYFRRNGFWVLFILTFFVGIALRFHNLNRFDFWYDEVISVIVSKKIPNLLTDYPMLNATPPLFNILLKMWMYLGEEEFIMRLLPLIFGVLSIFWIYKIGEHLFHKTIGLLSAFMISISAFHVYYSQELRTYSLITFLSIGSMFFLVRVLKENKLNLWAAYVVFTILCIYSHSYTAFLIIAQNIFFLIFYKRYRYLFEKWLIAQAIILFLYTPWIKIFLKQLPYITTSWQYGWMATGNLRDFFNTLSIFLVGYAPMSLRLSSLLIMVPLFISGLWFFKKEKEGIFLLGFWLFVPILIALLTSKLFFHIYLYRTLIYVSPAFYIISSLGIYKLYKFKKEAIFIFLIIFIGLLTIALRDHYKNVLSLKSFDRIGVHPKKEHKIATNYIQKNFKDGDLIGHTSHCTIPSFWFYAGQKDIDRRLGNIVSDGFIEDQIALKNFVKGHKRIWLIYSEWDPETLYNSPNREENRIKRWLDENFILLDFKKFIGIEVYLYQLENLS